MSARHDLHNRQLLQAIESGRFQNQRELSRGLGIALGLTNQLLRALVKQGLVCVQPVQRRSVRYQLTAAGRAERQRFSRAELDRIAHDYAATRARIRAVLTEISAACRDPKTVAFYGATELAEIAVISLRETDLHLVGIVDDNEGPALLGFPVFSREQLGPCTLAGKQLERLVITSTRTIEQIKSELDRCGFPPARVTWLQ